MSKRKRMAAAAVMACILFISQLAFTQASASKGKPDKGAEDLIIMQNLQESESSFKEKELQLQALHVYKDGHFKGASDSLVWLSANPLVAKVSKNGKVKLTGKTGAAPIFVTDGRHKDMILVSYKKNGKAEVKKQKGKRYAIIDKAISKMSLKEKIGQMLMPDFRTGKGENVTEMLPEIEQLVKDYHLGGVILFRENVVTTEQTAALVSSYQDAAEKYGLLMTIDQEGGIVTRLQSGTDMPGNMALGASRSEELAEKSGKVIGEELNALGFNLNFAPVMDVNNNPDNPVIGVRSFGENPQLVAELGTAYMKGLQAAGVGATAKHFPGHGDTAVDSHLGLPEVGHDLERLKAIELYPFQKGMEAGLDAIMTAHVTFPNIDGTKAISKKTGEEIAVPATLSYKVLTELMREEMGYEGVITTDAMNMNAIAEHFGPVDAAIRTVKAGTDIVLMPVGLKEVAEGLTNEVKNGGISEKRIEASVKRILTLKLKRGIMKEESPKPLAEKIANAQKVVGSAEHKQIEKEAARGSITLVKNEAALPLNLTDEEEVVVLGSSYVTDLADAVKAKHPGTSVIALDSAYRLTAAQLEQIRRAKAVIVGTHTSTVSARSPESAQMKMVNQVIREAAGPVIAVGIRNPYDIMAFPEVDAYLAQYGFRTASFEGSAAAIFGEFAPNGKLPVTIPGVNGGVLYSYGHGLTY